ncbi:MAG TPA: lytic transglycosylase [Alistipes sp.]|nr:lytic transglycosylase [Alistipes sp.]
MNLPTKKLLPALFVFALLAGEAFASSDALALVKRRKKRKTTTEQPAQAPAPAPQAEPTPAPEAEPERLSLTRPTPPFPEAVDNLTPAQYDSLLHVWSTRRALESYERFFEEYIAVDPALAALDNTPDSVYVDRLRALASPVQLPFNDIVKAVINRYTSPESTLMSRVLGMSQYYFPMIEEELIKAGLPIELRALPIIESALSPNAVSRAGAAGLWQFMPATGKMYGLEINSLVDERFDPRKATLAACRYLKDLYGIYHDWPLALAAYNCGPGNVNKAIARSGGRDFWSIYDYLPRETRGYVPAFIAASYASAYHGQHGIRYTEPPLPLATDTLHVDRLLHLGQVASSVEGVSIETLRLLNPQYRIDIIPATTKSYVLTLPQYAVAECISASELIRSKDSMFLKEYIDPANIDKKRAAESAASTFYHTVKRGETLGGIARRYHVTQQNIMRWNKLKSAHRIREGQRLKIVGRRR